MSEDIEKQLGLNPISVYEEKPIETAEEKTETLDTDEQAHEDIESARDNMYDAIDTIQQAIQEMAAIASSSQHPKSYEALNSLLKTYTDISGNIVELHVKKGKITTKKPDEEGGQTINNNNLITTTEDVIRMLANKREENDHSK